MKVHVDCSILLADGTAYGMVAGELEFEVLPRIGEVILLGEVEKYQRPRTAGHRFSGHFEVEQVMHRPIPTENVRAQLSLKCLTLETADEARDIMTYLEICHKLYGDVFDQNS